MTAIVATHETILVVGGGISGMTAALEAAETRKTVVLLEQRPFLGGRVAQFYQYFPKLCFPTCGLEINQRRIKQNSQLTVLTQAEVIKLTGNAGNYTATIQVSPRYINENCTACGACTQAVTAKFPDEFNYNLSQRKGVYLPHRMAYPQRYVLDPAILNTPDAERAKNACRYDAIDLEMRPEILELRCGTVIWATGWRPYDAAKIQPYGYGRFSNVITSVEFERIADPHGPTCGRIIRPSDQREAKKIAFIQCAGSRDRNHLIHCSRICCTVSLKQANYILAAYGEQAEINIYYIDLRVIDRLEDFYQKIRARQNLKFIKSKPAQITQDLENNLIIHGVDTEGYHRFAETYDLVVLAIGMEPAVKPENLPASLRTNRAGFLAESPSDNLNLDLDLNLDKNAIFAAGCASDALDVNRSVQHATGAALRAVQTINRFSAVGS